MKVIVAYLAMFGFALILKLLICAIIPTILYFGCTWLGLDETTSLIIAVIAYIVSFFGIGGRK